MRKIDYCDSHFFLKKLIIQVARYMLNEQERIDSCIDLCLLLFERKNVQIEKYILFFKKNKKKIRNI